MHAQSHIPKKSSKEKPLSEDDKAANKKLAAERMPIEHIIEKIKVFRILAERYRNRSPKHNDRVEFICGIYNYEIK